MRRSKLVIRCQDHPTYRGLRKPRVECADCEFVHRMRGATFGRRVTAAMRPDGFDEWVQARVGSA